MATQLKRTLEPSPDGLIALAAEARSFLAEGGVSGEGSYKVQLALEEVIRNLLLHGSGSATGLIDVALEVAGRRVDVCVEDDGAPFDPRRAPPFDPSQPLEDRSGGGMGLALLRLMMDEIRYERRGTRNCLHLVVAF